MRRLFAIALSAALGLSCGGQGTGGQLGFELFLQRAVPDHVGSLQVALLFRGNSYSCDQVQRTCLANQVPAEKRATDLVQLPDKTGKQHSALLFPLALDGGNQDLSISGIPVGQNFAVVVEALTRDSPPRLYGSYCTYVKEISAGVNDGQTVFATLSATQIDGGAYPGTDGGFSADCDPRFEK